MDHAVTAKATNKSAAVVGVASAVAKFELATICDHMVSLVMIVSVVIWKSIWVTVWVSLCGWSGLNLF